MSAPLPSPSTGLGLTLTVLLTVLVAGCIGGASDTDVDDGPVDNETDEPIENRTNGSQIEFPDDAPFDPNSSLHPHDYWGNQEEIVIADRHQVEGFHHGYTVEKCTTGGLACPPRGAREVAIPIDPEADKPTYVYPGTGKIEVSLDWEGANTFNVEPTLCVTNSGNSPLAVGCLARGQNQAYNASHTFSTPGETWTMEGEPLISSQTWDVPHTLKSKWRFLLLAEQCAQEERGTFSAQCIPADIDTFYFSAKIVRGDQDLPLDPPHLDYYGGASSLVALPQTTLDDADHPLQGDCDQSGPVIKPTTSWYSEQAREQETEPLCQFRGGALFNKAYREEPEGRAPIIPPGTSLVEIELAWDAGDDAPNAPGVHLGYRDAATNWDEGWTKPDPASCSGGTCTYELPIGNEEADSLYAIKSVWEFAVFPDIPEQPASPWDGISVDMSVTAHKEV